VSNGSARRLSRGDRRRNDKIARLRGVVTRETAVLAFNVAADKQVCALTDRTRGCWPAGRSRRKAWQLSEAVQRGLARAAEAGFDSVVVACEPTGHRWRVLDQIAAGLGVRLVCVQPLLVHRAREGEDFTRNAVTGPHCPDLARRPTGQSRPVATACRILARSRVA
jgi:transposase